MSKVFVLLRDSYETEEWGETHCVGVFKDRSDAEAVIQEYEKKCKEYENLEKQYVKKYKKKVKKWYESLTKDEVVKYIWYYSLYFTGYQSNKIPRNVLSIGNINSFIKSMEIEYNLDVTFGLVPPVDNINWTSYQILEGEMFD